MDGQEGDGLQLEKVGRTFSSSIVVLDKKGFYFFFLYIILLKRSFYGLL